MPELYFNDEGYAYPGVYQKIGKLSFSGHDRLWTILGAALVDMVEVFKYRDVSVYTDSRVVEEWKGEVEFLTPTSRTICNLIKKMLKENKAKITLNKVDPLSLQTKILSFKPS